MIKLHSAERTDRRQAHSWFRRLSLVVRRASGKKDPSLPGFPHVILRVVVFGPPSTNVPATVKELIASSLSALQDGRLLLPLGQAIQSCAKISARITNGYGEILTVTVRNRLWFE